MKYRIEFEAFNGEWRFCIDGAQERVYIAINAGPATIHTFLSPEVAEDLAAALNAAASDARKEAA